MGAIFDHEANGFGRYESTLGAVKLPGCAKCHAPHPLALKPRPADLAHCHNCGEPVAEPTDHRFETSQLNLPPIARLFMALGDWLYRLARRIDK